MSIVEEFRNRIRIGEQWEEITWKVGPARVLLAYIEWLEQQLADTGTTHFDGCHYRGPKHYWCALRKIEQLEANQIPEGFVAVPREPTYEMMRAGCPIEGSCERSGECHGDCHCNSTLRDIYRAMIQAATYDEGE